MQPLAPSEERHVQGSARRALQPKCQRFQPEEEAMVVGWQGVDGFNI